LQKHKLSYFVSQHFPVGRNKLRLNQANKASPKQGDDNPAFEAGDFESLRHCSPRFETKRLRQLQSTPDHSIIEERSASKLAYEGVKSKVLSELLNTPKLLERDNNEVIRSEIDDLVSKIVHEFEEHRIDPAFNYLNELKKFQVSEEEDLAYYNSKIRENATLFNNIETYQKECQDVLKELHDEEVLYLAIYHQIYFQGIYC